MSPVPDAAPRPVPFDLETLGAGLAFVQSLPELQRVLAEERVAVVQAPPGTGKTTLVPPAAANLLAARAGRDADRPGKGVTSPAAGGRPADGVQSGRDRPGRAPLKVVVTQPRRVAARAAARRLASLDRPAEQVGHGRHTEPGRTGRADVGTRTGYTVRGERTTSRETLVEFVTPGILVNRLLTDPELAGTGAVVLDEVHERDLESDVLFGMLGEVAQLRPDLLLVAMSATLDAARFADRLGAGTGRGVPVPVVDCPSALHPVDVSYRPHSGPRQDTRGVTRAFLDHVARCAVEAHAQALATEPGTDALVFVPGAREVTVTCERIARLAPGTEVLPLHGQLTSAQQDRAVGAREPGGAPRIIVSTSLAESSLTVPGVRLVVDSGLAREPRRDTARGMTGLVTVTCAQSSAQQRAGRAGRLGPGRVVRCYERASLGAAPAHPTPAVQVADLTGAALVLACWGAPGGAGLVLPDPLPHDSLAEAVATLEALDAIDDAGRATDHGRRLAAIPAEPRLARALLDGAGLVGSRAAAEVVALVSSDIRPDGADLAGALAALRSGGTERGEDIRDGGAARWRQEVRRFEGPASSTGGPATGSGRGRSPGTRAPGELTVGAVVGLAWPERLARRVSTSGAAQGSGRSPSAGPGAGAEVYLLASGTRAALPPGSALAGSDWLAIAEVSRAEGRAAAGTGAVIRAAAPVDAELAQRLAGPLLVEESTAHWQDDRVVGRLRRAIGAIVLSETPMAPEPDQGRAAVVQVLRGQGLGPLGVSATADALRRRLALLHRELGEPWPDVSDAALAEDWEAWLAPEVERLAGGARAGSVHLADALRRLLPWPAAVRLDELVPERLRVPSGRTAAVQYPAASAGDGEDDADAPVVAVKLQECFGLAETPRLVDGRVPVVFHLLSPAGRPLAVTGDLASFWSGPYAQVRAEMRGRYPKHPWPEDPWTAPATAQTMNRR